MAQFHKPSALAEAVQTNSVVMFLRGLVRTLSAPQACVSRSFGIAQGGSSVKRAFWQGRLRQVWSRNHRSENWRAEFDCRFRMRSAPFPL